MHAPSRTKSHVPHQKRTEACGALHITLRRRDGLPSLRTQAAFEVLERAFRAGKERFGCRVLHFSVLSNHMHMVVEARDRRSVSRGMQGLTIRLAKALNRLWKRKGKVFADRYHDRVLKTFGEIRKAIRYVLLNARKHGIRIQAGVPDFFSSGRWFTGWCGFRAVSGEPPVAEPQEYLTSILSMRERFSLDEVPGRTPDHILDAMDRSGELLRCMSPGEP